MTKFLTGGAMAAALVAVVPAIAQPAPPTPPGVAQGTTPAPVLGVPQVRVQTEVHRMPMMMPETRNEVVTHVREMFAKLDTNRDGFVTREEAEAAHEMMGGEMRDHRFVQSGAPPLPPLPHLDRNAMFDRMDTNHDGMISRQEFDAHAQVREERRVVMMHRRPIGAAGMPGMERMHEMGMRMHARMFEMADANRDGKVSLQEMTDAALRHFDMADANHDGRITPEERAQMHQRFKEMKRPA